MEDSPRIERNPRNANHVLRIRETLVPNSDDIRGRRSLQGDGEFRQPERWSLGRQDSQHHIDAQVPQHKNMVWANHRGLAGLHSGHLHGTQAMPNIREAHPTMLFNLRSRDYFHTGL